MSDADAIPEAMKELARKLAGQIVQWREFVSKDFPAMLDADGAILECVAGSESRRCRPGECNRRARGGDASRHPGH